MRWQRRISSIRVVLAVEDLGEPVAQTGRFLREPLMLHDDLVLAPFQRMVEFVDRC